MALKRVVLRGQIDPSKNRIALEQGDIGTKELGGTNDAKDITVALSGKLDYGARAAAGNRACRQPDGCRRAQTGLAVVHRAPGARLGGAASRQRQRSNGSTSRSTRPGPRCRRAVRRFPTTRCRSISSPAPARCGRSRACRWSATPTSPRASPDSTATVTLGKGNVEVSPGRRLALSNVVFEVPDMRPSVPPARVRFRVEGSVPAASELLALERLRDFSGTPFDAATTRGMLSAQVNLAMPLRANLERGSTTYNLAVDLTNFSADRMMLGHKVEAQTLRVTANNQGFQMRGDVRDQRHARADRISQGLERTRLRAQTRDHTRRAGADEARHGFRQHRHRGDSDPYGGPHRRDGQGQPLQRRGRSHSGEDRPASARLGQAAGQAGAHDLHHEQGQGRDPLRRSPDRRAGRAGEGLDRGRCQRRTAIRELPGLCDVRRRQGDDEGGSRPRRAAARGDARRRVRRPQFREVVDVRADRSESESQAGRRRSRHQSWRRGRSPR